MGFVAVILKSFPVMLWLVDTNYTSRNTKEIPEVLMLRSETGKLEGQHPAGGVRLSDPRHPLGPI